MIEPLSFRALLGVQLAHVQRLKLRPLGESLSDRGDGVLPAGLPALVERLSGVDEVLPDGLPLGRGRPRRERRLDEDALRELGRSNVESAISAIKRKFGAWLRSRTEVAQVNELLLKILVYNVMCLVEAIVEFGLEPVFSRDVGNVIGNRAVS